jgi:hypothetical protein
MHTFILARDLENIIGSITNEITRYSRFIFEVLNRLVLRSLKSRILHNKIANVVTIKRELTIKIILLPKH